MGQNKNTVTSNHGYTMVDLKTSDTQSQKKSCGHGSGTCEKLHNFRHFTRHGLHELTVFCLTPAKALIYPHLCVHIYLSIYSFSYLFICGLGTTSNQDIPSRSPKPHYPRLKFWRFSEPKHCEVGQDQMIQILQRTLAFVQRNSEVWTDQCEIKK